MRFVFLSELGLLLVLFAIACVGAVCASEPLPLSAPPAAPLIAQVSPEPAGPTSVGEPATTSPVRGTVRPVSTTKGLCLCGEDCGCCATVEAKLAEMQSRLDAWEAFGVEYRQWQLRSGVSFATHSQPADKRTGAPQVSVPWMGPASSFYSPCPGGVCYPRGW